MNLLDIPEIDAVDDDTPDGLYRLKGKVQTLRELYNASTDSFRRNVVCQLCVRIDKGTELPRGVPSAVISNGRRVIRDWVPVEEGHDAS